MKPTRIKDFGLLLAGLFALLVVAWPQPAMAGIYWELPDNSTLLMSLRRVETDDAGDPDPVLTEQPRYVLEIENRARRFVGLYVDRLYPNGSVAEIDNGVNDWLISPAEHIGSASSLLTYVGTALGYDFDDISKSRRLVLPIPQDLEPGEEVQFQVHLLGLATYKPFPYDLWGANAPPQANRLLLSAGASLANLVLGPLVRQSIGLTSANDNHAQALAEALVSDVIAHMESSPDWINKFVQGDYVGFCADYAKHLASSQTMVTELQDHANGDLPVDRILSTLGDLMAAWSLAADAGDTGVMFGHLLEAQWEERYLVRVVKPRIDAFSPVHADAGEVIEIQGIGFQPGELERNQARFTWRDIDGSTYQAQRLGEVLGGAALAPTASSLYVRLPTDLAPGPVEVSVDGLESNRRNFAAYFDTTVQIVSPVADAWLEGSLYDVHLRIADPPANFPDQMAEASLYVDYQLIASRSVGATDVHFSLDMEPLAVGPHTLSAEVMFYPDRDTASDAIDIVKACSVSEPSDRWLFEYDFDCDGTSDSDALWHLRADGSISDHWSGVIADYSWRLMRPYLLIYPDSTTRYMQGRLSDDCRRVEDGHWVDTTDPTASSSCFTARKY